MGDISFAEKTRRELGEVIGKSRHCQKAELAAIFEAHFVPDDSGGHCFFSEGLTVYEKCIILFRKAFRTNPIVVEKSNGNEVWIPPFLSDEVSEVFASEELLSRECCKRAYLRGWFLSSGTIAAPVGHYHLEIVTSSEEKASYIREIVGVFGLEAKISIRKGHYVIYMKDGQTNADFLNVVGAHVALMEFENARILKEMRGKVNRQVNCETANIKKTASASARQLDDIRYIRDTVGFGSLSDSLSQIAKARLENPEVTLKELGEKLDPPIGKSGVNHRLRRLSEIAESLREKT